MQTDAGEQVEEQVLKPMRGLRESARQMRRAKAAATKADFFTMARSGRRPATYNQSEVGLHIAVKGGERAIENVHAWVAWERRND